MWGIGHENRSAGCIDWFAGDLYLRRLRWREKGDEASFKCQSAKGKRNHEVTSKPSWWRKRSASRFDTCSANRRSRDTANQPVWNGTEFKFSATIPQSHQPFQAAQLCSIGQDKLGQSGRRQAARLRQCKRGSSLAGHQWKDQPRPGGGDSPRRPSHPNHSTECDLAEGPSPLDAEAFRWQAEGRIAASWIAAKSTVLEPEPTRTRDDMNGYLNMSLHQLRFCWLEGADDEFRRERLVRFRG